MILMILLYPKVDKANCPLSKIALIDDCALGHYPNNPQNIAGITN